MFVATQVAAQEQLDEGYRVVINSVSLEHLISAPSPELDFW